MEDGNDKGGILDGVLSVVKGYVNPADVQTLVNLFDPNFRVGEVWDAMEAAAHLGREAEAFLAGLHPLFGAASAPEVRAVIPARSVGDDELCAQLMTAVAEAPPVMAAAGDQAADSPVPADAKQLNPLVAGLLVALIQRLAQQIISRIGGG